MHHFYTWPWGQGQRSFKAKRRKCIFRFIWPGNQPGRSICIIFTLDLEFNVKGHSRWNAEKWIFWLIWPGNERGRSICIIFTLDLESKIKGHSNLNSEKEILGPRVNVMCMRQVLARQSDLLDYMSPCQLHNMIGCAAITEREMHISVCCLAHYYTLLPCTSV